MRRLRLPLVKMVLVVAVALLPSMPSANAEPAELPSLANSPTLSLQDLGSDPDLTFYGQVGSVLLTLPVPAGMTPQSLNVTAQIPVYVRSATVVVSQDNRVLARVEVPPDGGPMIIPLDGVRVDANSASLLVRTYLLPLEGYCLDPTNPMRLTNSAITFAGVERSPTAVADFLPPILHKLVIYVDRSASQAEADAVVRLATAVVAYYGRQRPEIEVAPLARPREVPPGGTPPLERHVVISEGPDAGVSLYGPGPMPALLIAGSAGDLTNQTRLLTSGVDRFALSSRAVAGPLKSTPQLPGDDTTIRELGQPGVNATALNPQVGINLDQTRLGRSARGIRVHLMGSYTPLPNAIGGQVVATVAGETVAQWPAEASGVVDRWVDIPDRLLQRFTTLAVQVNISGNTGRCGEFQPITLTIDGESVVQTSLAKPPVPLGFQSLPQALMPRVVIGISADTYGDTVRAVSIMTGLQRLSALPIDTAVVPLKEAVDSANPAVLISPDGWSFPELPIRVTAPETVPMILDVRDDNGNPTTLTLDPAVKFGSLQTVFDRGRSVLVATSHGGAVGQLDELLRWLGADEGRWSALNGIGVLSVPGRDPVTVPGGVGTVHPAAGSGPGASALWWVGGGLLTVLGAGLAAVYLSRSRRPRSSE